MGILLMCTAPVCAQQVEVRPFELEVKGIFVTPLARVEGYHRCLGPGLAIEARWNKKNSPMDYGVELAYSDIMLVEKETDIRGGGLTVSLQGYADYNLFRGRGVSLFGGLGAGIGHLEGGYDDDSDHGIWAPVFTPRLGFEFSRHTRLTFDLRLSRKYYNSFEVSLGYAFGGGKKRKKTE